MYKIESDCVPGLPGTGQTLKNPVLSRPVARFWASPVVHLSRDNLSLCPKKSHCPIPLETLVQISQSSFICKVSFSIVLQRKQLQILGLRNFPRTLLNRYGLEHSVFQTKQLRSVPGKFLLAYTYFCLSNWYCGSFSHKTYLISNYLQIIWSKPFRNLKLWPR